MILNRDYTFIAAFGRRAINKTVTYRLLDSALSEVLTWTAGVQDLTKGRYGKIIALDNLSVTYIQFRAVEAGETTLYITIPVNIANYANRFTFIASYGRRRIDKTVEYRLLDSGFNELAGYTAVDVNQILPKFGDYGAVLTIADTNVAYIQFKDVEDDLYITTAVNRVEPDFAATEFKYAITGRPVGLHIPDPVFNYLIINQVIRYHVSKPQIKLTITPGVEVNE